MRKPTQTNAIRAILIYLSQPLLHDIEMSRKNAPMVLVSAVNYFKASRSFSRTRSAKFIEKLCFRHFPENLFCAQISSDRARHFALSRFTNISTICFMANRHHNFGFLFLAFLTREKSFIFILQRFSVWSVNVRHLMLNYSLLFNAFVWWRETQVNLKFESESRQPFFLLCLNTSISASNNFLIWKRMSFEFFGIYFLYVTDAI